MKTTPLAFDFSKSFCEMLAEVIDSVSGSTEFPENIEMRRKGTHLLLKWAAAGSMVSTWQ